MALVSILTNLEQKKWTLSSIFYIQMELAFPKNHFNPCRVPEIGCCTLLMMSRVCTVICMISREFRGLSRRPGSSNAFSGSADILIYCRFVSLFPNGRDCQILALFPKEIHLCAKKRSEEICQSLSCLLCGCGLCGLRFVLLFHRDQSTWFIQSLPNRS